MTHVTYLGLLWDYIMDWLFPPNRYLREQESVLYCIKCKGTLLTRSPIYTIYSFEHDRIYCHGCKRTYVVYYPFNKRQLRET